MDIRGINRNINLHEYESLTKENTAKKENKKTVTGDKSDKIQISAEAKHLNIIDFATTKIKAELQREIPAEKINKLKAQIQSGLYKTDAQSVAKAILTGAVE